MMETKLAVILHGGAGNSQTNQEREIELPFMKRALDAAWKALVEGAPGEVAVVEGLRILEGCEYFNAGYGGALNEDGKAFTDVALMRGNGDFISLMNMSKVKYPSAVALDLFKPGLALARVWTEKLATSIANVAANLKERYGYVATEEEMISSFSKKLLERSKRRTGDTVGCVVRDASGKIFAGTSTGGVMNKPDGRIGDAPIIGSGVFADDRICGLSATGTGELVLKSAVSGMVIAEIRRALRTNTDLFVVDKLALGRIVDSEIKEMKARLPNSDCGLIVIPSRGDPVYSLNARCMTVALRHGSKEAVDYEEVKIASGSL